MMLKSNDLTKLYYVSGGSFSVVLVRGEQRFMSLYCMAFLYGCPISDLKQDLGTMSAEFKLKNSYTIRTTNKAGKTSGVLHYTDEMFTAMDTIRGGSNGAEMLTGKLVTNIP